MIFDCVMSTVESPGGPGSATPCQPLSSVESSVYLDPRPGRGLLTVTRPSMLARRLSTVGACAGYLGPVRRRKREMIPADKKDATYWDKRRKNNEAAKRSREKRRFNDLVLEGQLLALSEENAQLRTRMLNLHYHTSLNIDKSETASHFASSPVLASTLSLSPVPAHSPALFQAGLWGTSGGSSALMGVKPQETAMHQFETKIPCFSSSRSVFNHLGHHSCIAQQGPVSLPRPRVLSHGGQLGIGRSVEAEIIPDSSSNGIPIPTDAPSQPFTALPTFLPPLDTFQHASNAPRAQNWMVSHLNHSAMCTNVLPWRPSYLATPAVYPYLHLHESQGHSPGGCGGAHPEGNQEPVQQSMLRAVSIYQRSKADGR